MRKKLAILLVLALLVGLAGCGTKPGPVEPDQQESTSNMENPFQQDEEPPFNMGSISHGPRNPNLDENERLLPLAYNGKEIQ